MAVVLGRRWVCRQRGAVGARVRQLAFMSGRHSTLLTHMIFWAFRPLSLSIIHGRFNRVIPLATYPRDWPLARPLTALIRGLTLDLQALLLRGGEMESLQLGVHRQTFLLPCLPSHIAQNSLEENFGFSTSIPFQPKVLEVSTGLSSARAEVESIPWCLFQV